MNQAIVYHWWGHASDADPVCNLRTPIIASIASLRNVSNIPVYVIDVSPDHCPQKHPKNVAKPSPNPPKTFSKPSQNPPRTLPEPSIKAESVQKSSFSRF